MEIDKMPHYGVYWTRVPKNKKNVMLAAFIDKNFSVDDKFSTRSEKNNRGDYGIDEVYSFHGVPAFFISFDGARLDAQVYIYINGTISKTVDFLRLKQKDITE